MNRRSLTLLEVLIVTALLLGMAAVLAPTVISTLDEQAFESAADVTGEQLMLARAHAQATGQSVEVRYNRGESRVEARFFMPWMMSYQMAASVTPSDATSVADSNADRQTQDALDARTAISEAWASRAISKSVRIGSHRSVGLDASDTASHTGFPTSRLADAAAIEAELTSADDVRLAVFMPDGSALLNEPFWFEDEGGRVGRLTINPFSGLPAWERLLDLTESFSSGEDDREADDERASDGVDEFEHAGALTPPQ